MWFELFIFSQTLIGLLMSFGYNRSIISMRWLQKFVMFRLVVFLWVLFVEVIYLKPWQIQRSGGQNM
jgi:hypothetical protein